MKTLDRRICIVLLATTLVQAAFAQINNGPRPAVYSVISVDSDTGTVRLRAPDGWTGVVYVAEEVYDLSKLKVGGKIRVNFLAPDDNNKKLRAASIWPTDGGQQQ